VDTRSRYTLKRPIFALDVAVQTENTTETFKSETQPVRRHTQMNFNEEQEIAPLSASNLASILKWSKDISSDINLSSGEVYFAFSRFDANDILSLAEID
jgi:hypothetical protein